MEQDDSPAPKTLRHLLDEYERDLIRLALDSAGGSQKRAAETLGVLPSTLCEKMRRLGLRQRRRRFVERAVVGLLGGDGVN